MRCPIHVEVIGDDTRPSIVMVLGLGMRVAEWPASILQSLSKDFHLICVENRDAGLSCRCGPDIDPRARAMLTNAALAAEAPPYTLYDMRDDVLRTVTEAGIERFAVVGFSMGGMIAQLVAAKAQERVTGLAQICSSAGEATLPTPPGAAERFIRTATPFDTHGELVDWLTEDLIWWSAPTYVCAKEARTAAIDAVAAGFSTGAYARQLLALNRSGDRRAELRKITAPTLVIGGESDRCIPPDSSRSAHALIPQSKLVLVEGMGHSMDPKAMRGLQTWLTQELIH